MPWLVRHGSCDTAGATRLVRTLVQARLAQHVARQQAVERDRDNARPPPDADQGHAMTNTDSPAAAFAATEITASLTVKDLEQSLAWYRDVVGFTVDQRHERDGKLAGVSLRAGAVRLLIGQDNGAKGWDRVKGEGFSLMLTTTEDVDALAEAITQRGGTLDLPPTTMPWGARAFRLQDPDGYRFAISSPR